MFYQTEQQSEKTLICIVEIDGQKFTVRDQGMLNIVGGQICEGLVDLAYPATPTLVPTRTPIPTPTPVSQVCWAVWENEVVVEVSGPNAMDICEEFYFSGFQLYSGTEAPWGLCRVDGREHVFRVSRPDDSGSWEDFGDADLGVCDWLWSESELP